TRCLTSDAKILVHDFVAMREVNDDVCVVSCRESVSMHSDAGGGRKLDENVFVVELHRIVTGCSCFVSMLEAAGVIAPNRRYQQDVAVIGNARTAEVCVTESIDLRVGVVITRAAVPAYQLRARAE